MTRAIKAFEECFNRSSSAKDGSFVEILHLSELRSCHARCPVLGKTTFAFSRKAVHTISASFPFFAPRSDRRAEKGGRRRGGEAFQFEAAGFVSKPSVVWLNYKCTCLITSLSGACQGLHPKNKP